MVPKGIVVSHLLVIHFILWRRKPIVFGAYSLYFQVPRRKISYRSKREYFKVILKIVTTFSFFFFLRNIFVFCYKIHYLHIMRVYRRVLSPINLLALRMLFDSWVFVLIMKKALCKFSWKSDCNHFYLMKWWL